MEQNHSLVHLSFISSALALRLGDRCDKDIISIFAAFSKVLLVLRKSFAQGFVRLDDDNKRVWIDFFDSFAHTVHFLAARCAHDDILVLFGVAAFGFEEGAASSRRLLDQRCDGICSS